MFRSTTDLLRRLAGFELAPADYFVAGSAPLLMYGLRDQITDIDIVVRAERWHAMERLGETSRAQYDAARAIFLDGGRLHILDRWFPSLWDTEQLHSSTVSLSGHRFLSLPATVTWKRYRHKPQDQLDVEAIEGFWAHPK